MLDKFRKLDAFGHSIGLTYQGNDTFKTSCGATGTVIMYIILFVYAIDGLLKVYNDDVKSIYKDVTFLNIDEQGVEPFEFAPDGDNIYGDGFDLAIGLTSGKQLGPEHGSFKVEYRIKDKKDPNNN